MNKLLKKDKVKFQNFMYQVWTKRTDESTGKYGKMLRLISIVEYDKIIEDIWQRIKQELIQARIDENKKWLRSDGIKEWGYIIKKEFQESVKQLKKLTQNK